MSGLRVTLLAGSRIRRALAIALVDGAAVRRSRCSSSDPVYGDSPEGVGVPVGVGDDAGVS